MSEQIYSEGKITFTSTLHACDVQRDLIQAGYEYEIGKQRIRPSAYGVMWRREWEDGKYTQKMRTAGNIRVLKSYSPPNREGIYIDTRVVISNTAPGRTKVFENCQAEQRKTTQIVYAIFDYLLGLGIGYDFTARRTKLGTPIRVATWTAFAHLLNELHPNAKPWQVRRAINTRYKNSPENKKLKELLGSRRPEGLAIGAIKI